MADAFATITQKRMTGGFRLDDIDGKNIHIDPGPGALVRTYQFGLNPLNLNGVLVSHCHTDHYTDAEVLIEAMTKGMTRKKGLLIGSRSVINGFEKWGPSISNYHLSKPQVTVLGENTEENRVRYIYNELGKGFWTFYSGHDPEGSPGPRKISDLSLYPHSPGYRLILNNVLFPSAKKKKQKT